MSKTSDIKRAEKFLQEHPEVLEILKSPENKNILQLLSAKNSSRIEYFIQNSFLAGHLQKVITIIDHIMNISPEISEDELLNILCRDVAILANANGVTCRTYDPEKNVMVASGNYNWDVKRTEEIPYEDSIAGHVIRTKTHYIVPDISIDPLYKEKDKLIALGINSMLALPIQLIDYDGTQRKEILIGTLQMYFNEKNKMFYLQQIHLIKSILGMFSYVMAQKRRLALQKKAAILHESRKALLSILKHTQSLDQVLNFLVAKIAEIINVNRCSFFSIEKDASENSFAILIAGYPLDPFAHSYGITLSFHDHPAFREVCKTGKPLLIENARNDPRMKASYELYLNKKIKNVYFMPIKDEYDNVSHVLVLDGDESKPLDEEDIFFCNSLIQEIQLCIQASLSSQERHDTLNQMISFGALARLYTKKLRSQDISTSELNDLYNKLFKNMLTVEDIITDNIPYAQKEKFNLNQVILERLEVYSFHQQVTIQKDLYRQNLYITADRKKVGRIVGNLLDNAHKKLEELQGGILKVSTTVINNHAIIEIGNTGIIPPEIRDHVFKNYYPYQDKMGKTRLGLSIVKLFTIMHNGSVEFESTPEKNWTAFRIKLPL